jgi:hypothetical protein
MRQGLTLAVSLQHAHSHKHATAVVYAYTAAIQHRLRVQCHLLGNNSTSSCSRMATITITAAQQDRYKHNGLICSAANSRQPDQPSRPRLGRTDTKHRSSCTRLSDTTLLLQVSHGQHITQQLPCRILAPQPATRGACTAINCPQQTLSTPKPAAALAYPQKPQQAPIR